MQLTRRAWAGSMLYRMVGCNAPGTKRIWRHLASVCTNPRHVSHLSASWRTIMDLCQPQSIHRTTVATDPPGSHSEAHFFVRVVGRLISVWMGWLHCQFNGSESYLHACGPLRPLHGVYEQNLSSLSFDIGTDSSPAS
jgi:hypothetical protein